MSRFFVSFGEFIVLVSMDCSPARLRPSGACDVDRAPPTDSSLPVGHLEDPEPVAVDDVMGRDEPIAGIGHLALHAGAAMTRERPAIEPAIPRDVTRGSRRARRAEGASAPPRSTSTGPGGGGRWPTRTTGPPAPGPRGGRGARAPHGAFAIARSVGGAHEVVERALARVDARRRLRPARPHGRTAG